MFKLMDKKIIAILLSNILFNWPYVIRHNFAYGIPKICGDTVPMSGQVTKNLVLIASIGKQPWLR